MISNPFFKNKGPFTINRIFNSTGIKSTDNFKDEKVYDIKDLFNSTKKDITFFHSKKYKNLASKTKALFCITSDNLKDYLPKKCKKIITTNVLVATAKITKMFYPDSITDDYDRNVIDISKTSFKKKVDFGKMY